MIRKGATYRDPEGIWEIVDIYGDEVTVVNIDEDSLNEGDEYVLTREEIEQYLDD